MLFLKNKVQINKNNYATMPPKSKQVSPPEISSILQKPKIDPKCHIRPFCKEAFIYLSAVTNSQDLDYLLVVFCVFLLAMSKQVVGPEIHLLPSSNYKQNKNFQLTDQEDICF